MDKPVNYLKSIFFILLFFAFILLAVIFKLLSSVMIPLTIALLLSFALFPLLRTMNRKLHIPWILGIIIIIFLALVLFFTIGNIIVLSAKSIVNVYPKYEDRLFTLYSKIAAVFDFNFDKDSTLAQNLWSTLGIRNVVQDIALSLSSSMLTLGSNIFTIILLCVFLLLEMNGMRDKTKEAFKGDVSQKIETIVTKTIGEITGYISIKFIISLMTGALVFAGTAAVKLEFAIFWGFAAFLLNFIPTFGSIVSSVITIVFAILQFYPSFTQAVIVAVIMIAVNMILGNIVEPRWIGSDLGLSPFVVLVGLSLWGWMWGFIGMILAVPFMVMIKIICENVSYLKPVAILIGNKKSLKGKKSN